MGYYEVLEILQKEYKEISKQKKQINNELEYALTKNQIAKTLKLSIQSVNHSLKKLIKSDEIEYIENKIKENIRPIPHYYIKKNMKQNE